MKTKSIEFLNAKDIVEITNFGFKKAYSIIKQLNEMRKNENLYVERGKIPKEYFYKKMGVA